MKKYNVIYADPPWDYGNTKNLSGQFWGMADKHYPVMKFQDICNLPVQNICEDDCYLFLWVTSPFLEKGFELIKSWGFKYATVAEYCLIARKGKYWREARNVKQIIQYPKTNHSSKPKEVRKRIVELCGDIPRAELFARDLEDGWDSMGNEIDGRDIRSVLSNMDSEQ